MTKSNGTQRAAAQEQTAKDAEVRKGDPSSEDLDRTAEEQKAKEATEQPTVKSPEQLQAESDAEIEISIRRQLHDNGNDFANVTRSQDADEVRFKLILDVVKERITEDARDAAARASDRELPHTVLTPIRMDGKDHKPGALIWLTSKQAASMPWAVRFVESGSSPAGVDWQKLRNEK